MTSRKPESRKAGKPESTSAATNALRTFGHAGDPEEVVLPVGGGTFAISVEKGDVKNMIVRLPPGDGEFRMIVRVGDGAEASVTTVTDGVGDVALQRFSTIGKRGKLSCNDWVGSGASVTFRGEVALAGEEANAEYRTAFFRTGDERFDGILVMRHEAPRTRSRLFCEGVLDGKASASFLGKTVIGKGVIGCDADQRQRIVLLSDGASVRIDPVLEIATDDVQCGHGGSVGGLDAQKVFYLMSRGIPAAEAEAIVLKGFFAAFVRAVGEGSTMVSVSLARRINASRI